MNESSDIRFSETVERRPSGVAAADAAQADGDAVGVAGSSTPSTSVPEAPAAPDRVERPQIEYDVGAIPPRREFAVILYNDDVHAADDVVRQLMMALECSPGRATMLMLEAHNSGRATVAIASRDRAVRIATILRQIDLRVTIRQVN